MKTNKELISDLVIKTVVAYGQDILTSPVYLKQKEYIQHADVSVYQHCLSVACFAVYHAYLKGYKVDYRSLVRGALLHDFFLYDWHKPHKGYGLHGYTHPYTALKNADQYFYLNKKEKDIIKKHMFPLTPFFPRYKESWIVDYADDVVTIKETHEKAMLLKEKHLILLQLGLAA